MADPQTALQALDRGAMALPEVVGRVRRIQEVMQTLMKPDVHYGTIPGTPKPTLYQPGAELLCSTFRIAPSPQVEDLSTSNTVRYRVTMRGILQTTGEMLGEGVGECSSDEEKYRWRRPVCDEEWNETAEDRRREKWTKGKSGVYKAKHVRISPADIGNTVLKMAYKRALISMARVTLACSDIFNQDLEDLPAEVREAVMDAEHETEPPKPIQPPKAKGENGKAKAEPPAAGLTVTEVESRAGTTAAGRAWTVFVVTFSDGSRASTFDAKLALLAENCRDEHALVEAMTQPGKKEGTRNLVELIKVQPATADEAEG